MAYSPLNYQLLPPWTAICPPQWTLQLRPWQAYLEFSLVPGEYSALNTGLTAIAQKLEPATSLRLPNVKIPITPGWSEAVVKGRSAQLFHAVVGT